MAFTSQFPIQNISERCWRPIVRAIGWLTPWYKLNVAQKKGPIEIITGDVGPSWNRHFAFTSEFLANVLGVDRSTLTGAVGVL
jgi:hypothetical protein